MVPRTIGGQQVCYLPFPPVPSLVLVPIVAVFGPTSMDTSGACAIAGGISVWLVWVLLGRLHLSLVAALLLTVSFAFGSEFLYVSATGGPHHWVQVLAVTFALAALVLAVKRQWPYLGGLLFMLAVGCRLPILLAAPLYLGLYAAMPLRLRWPTRSGLGRLLDFGLGALPVGLVLAWYNVARFGSPFEFGYGLIQTLDTGALVTQEPWFASGIISPLYLPRGLYALLLRGFDFVDQPPWLRPTWMGTAVTFTMPFLVYLFRARWWSPKVVYGWIALLGALSIDLMHGSVGFAQYGYRFFLDVMPFAWLLLALVVRRYGLSRGLIVAVCIGIVMNGYGLWAAWGTSPPFIQY